MVYENFKLKNGNQTHEFKLGLLSQDHGGILVRLDKTMTKEAMVILMEDLRFYTRAKPEIDVIWGVATNLYEWQLVRYCKSNEVQ